VDAAAVGRHYGARTRDGVLDAWVLDTGDAASADGLEADGLSPLVGDLLMSTPDATAAFILAAAAQVAP